MRKIKRIIRKIKMLAMARRYVYLRNGASKELFWASEDLEKATKIYSHLLPALPEADQREYNRLVRATQLLAEAREITREKTANDFIREAKEAKKIVYPDRLSFFVLTLICALSFSLSACAPNFKNIGDVEKYIARRASAANHIGKLDYGQAVQKLVPPLAGLTNPEATWPYYQIHGFVKFDVPAVVLAKKNGQIRDIIEETLDWKEIGGGCETLEIRKTLLRPATYSGPEGELTVADGLSVSMVFSGKKDEKCKGIEGERFLRNILTRLYYMVGDSRREIPIF